jgi:hypothetical protein
MEGSVQINARESHSIEQERKKKPILSWEEIIEKSLSNFWLDGFLTSCSCSNLPCSLMHINFL